MLDIIRELKYTLEDWRCNGDLAGHMRAWAEDAACRVAIWFSGRRHYVQ